MRHKGNRCCAWSRLVLSACSIGVIATTDASAQILFQDVTQAAGLERIGQASGVSFFDFTGDGWDDLTFGAADGQVRLWENNRDGTFRDATQAGGLRGGGLQSAPVWFDFNGDPWPDLYVGALRNGRSALFVNRGDGTFTDETTAAGLDPDLDVAAVAAADMDRDGRVDLFLAVHQGQDRLYRNAGDGTFVEEAAARGVVDEPGSIPMQAVWVDVDQDMDQDLLAVYDGQVRSRLFVNDGTGHFTEAARDRGIADVGPGNSMGISIGELNGDGYPDIYISRIGTAGLFLSTGTADATFTEHASPAGVDRNGMSWGSVFADYDLDGDLDLAIVNTTGYDGTPSLFYEQTSDVSFSERGTSVGFGFASESYGLAWGDLDWDGLPDLIVSSIQGRHKLLRNASTPAGSALVLTLQGPPGNRTAVGARIEVSAGSRQWTRWMQAGDSFMSQQSRAVHVGLGNRSSVDAITVFWPDGSTSEQFDVPVPPEGSVRLGMAHAMVTGTTAIPDATIRPAPISVYPNPASVTGGPLYITGPAATLLTVFDALGRVVWQESGPDPRTTLNTTPNSSWTLYMAHLGLSPGLHAIQFRDDRGQITGNKTFLITR